MFGELGRCLCCAGSWSRGQLSISKITSNDRRSSAWRDAYFLESHGDYWQEFSLLSTHGLHNCGRGSCRLEFQCWWLGRWAELPGLSRIRLKWALGLRCCLRLL